MSTRTMTTSATSPSDPSSNLPTEQESWGPLLVVLAGTFVTFLDFFIVNVALPSIQVDLGAGPAAVQLVVAGVRPDLRGRDDHRGPAR